MRKRRQLPVLARRPQGAAPDADAAAAPYAAIVRAEWEASGALLDALRRHEMPEPVLVTGTAGADRVGAAVGLGAIAAVAGKRALLMECDFAEPGLARRLGLAATPGMRDYLSFLAEAPQLLQPLSIAGEALEGSEPSGQLVCITAGRPTPNGAQLLSSDAFAAALGKVSRAYDFVVLAGGALGSPGLSEVAARAGSMIVCVDGAKTSRLGGRKLRSALGQLPERPTGLLVEE